MTFLIIVTIIILVFFIKDIKNAENCCSDCINYKKCYGNSYNKNNLEAPPCKNFKERD